MGFKTFCVFFVTCGLSATQVIEQKILYSLVEHLITSVTMGVIITFIGLKILCLMHWLHSPHDEIFSNSNGCNHRSSFLTMISKAT